MPDTLTTAQVADLPPGTPVTLTFTHGPARHTWHMQFRGTFPATILRDGQRPLLYRMANGSAEAQREPGTQQWLTFATIHALGDVAHPHLGFMPEHRSSVSSLGINLAPDATGWTIEPLTDAGQAWATQNEPAPSKRDRLIQAVRDMDPVLAADLDDTIDRLVFDAKDDAIYAERHPGRW